MFGAEMKPDTEPLSRLSDRIRFTGFVAFSMISGRLLVSALRDLRNEDQVAGEHDTGEGTVEIAGN